MLFLDSKLWYSGLMGIFCGAIGRIFCRAGTVACIFSRVKDAVNQNTILTFREASSRKSKL